MNVAQKEAVSEMVVKTTNGEIPINRRAVHEVLGFPMGSVPINVDRRSNYNDPISVKWKKEIGESVSLKQVQKSMRATQSADLMFRVKFLVLMVSTLVKAMRDGKVNRNFLKSIEENSVISSFDWCGYVVDSIKHCKEDGKEPFYTGPITFLVLLYCDRVLVGPAIERRRPVIAVWVSGDLKNRKKCELESGSVVPNEFLPEWRETPSGQEYMKMMLAEHSHKDIHFDGCGCTKPDGGEEQTKQQAVESIRKTLEYAGKQIYNAIDRFGDDEDLENIKNQWDSMYSKSFSKPVVANSVASVLEEIRNHSQYPITWPSDGTLTLDWVTSLMKTFNWSSRNLTPSEFPKVLPVETFDALIRTGTKILEKEPNCVDVEPADKDAVVVVGDVHGQLHDVLFLLNRAGPPSQDRFFVFNGDYVDRGAWGLETFLILLAWKVFMPDRVFLLRGNHETKYCTTLYGFQQEVLAKYGDKGKYVYDECLGCFKELPLASIIAGCVYTAHGGLFRHIPPVSKRKKSKKVIPSLESAPLSLGSLEDLSKAKRGVAEPPSKGRNLIPADVLWSDPSMTDGLSPNTERGIGLLWGRDCTKDFLKKNGLKLIIRSHEGPDARHKRPGFKGMDKGYTVDHNTKYGDLITVFSAPDYPQFQATEERFNNKGAYIELKPPNFDTPVFHSFEAVTPRPKVDSYYDCQVVADSDEELDLSMMKSATATEKKSDFESMRKKKRGKKTRKQLQRRN